MIGFLASVLHEMADRLQSLDRTGRALELLEQRVNDTERAMVDMATAANIVALANAAPGTVVPFQRGGVS
ncbi:MAG TPA: hypothetical protein VF062_15440 [Candidatus Limnocylindrales bacterium]